MVRNVVFDIGNVILNFDMKRVLNSFTKNESEQDFIFNNIINSPEWLGYALIDTGYVSLEEAIEMVEDRTNHVNDSLIEKFWNNYNDYAFVSNDLLDIIKSIKKNGYNVYLLSNINPYTYEIVEKSGLFEIVDGYVLSYLEHQIKPYEGIYKTLIDRYNINSNESLFIDDKLENVNTANRLGFLGKNVLPDDTSSVIKILKEYNIKF